MRYMLDTNVLSDLIRFPGGRAAQRVRQLAANKVYTSIIVAGELQYGAIKKASAQLRQRVGAVLDAIPILALDAPCAEIYGQIRTQLEAKGQPIGSNDLWIAAHALSQGMTLVTGNVREFARVKGLNMENWLDCKAMTPQNLTLTPAI